MSMNEYLVALPLIYLTIAISVLLIYGAVPLAETEVRGKLREETNLSLKDGSAKLSTLCWLGVLSFVFTIGLYLGSDNLEYTGRFIINEYSRLISIVLLVASACVLIIATEGVVNKYKGKDIDLRQATASVNPYSYEMVILIQLAVAGLLLLVSAYDLLALYLSLELQSLSLYILASLKRTSEFSTEAGLKYFVLGAVSSGLLLFGSSLIYGMSGSIHFEDLAKSVDYIDSFVFAVGVLLVFSGLFFKLSIAPFHQWTPDVYEGSPTIVTTFFASVPKIAVVALCLRLIFNVFYGSFDALSVSFDSVIKPFLIFCCLASILVGSFGGLYQRKLKRLLAYSTIGHMGYLLLGIISGTIEGISSVFIYLLIYMVTTIGIFTLLLSVESQLPVSTLSQHRNRLVYLTDLSFLSHSNPALAFSLAIFMFSMAGIPPLAGFFSKLYVFLAALNSSLYLLAIVAVLLSAIGCFYYLRVLKYLYFSSASSPSYNPVWPHLGTLSLQHSVIISVAVFFLVFFIVYPGPILTLSLSLSLNLLV